MRITQLDALAQLARPPDARRVDKQERALIGVYLAVDGVARRPATSLTITRCCPRIAFTSIDLPTFGG